MTANPIIGVLFHWLGGLAAGSFYAPFKAVKKWDWEIYWIVGGLFSWIVAPWLAALIMIPHLTEVLSDQTARTLMLTFAWGILWGFGGLTFGLSVRYLGMSLGYAIVMGFCAIFGTYVPTIFEGTFKHSLETIPGQVILIGMFVCVLGISIAGAAGLSKEKELTETQRRKSISEFNLRKGILIAVFSGVMSSCFAYGLAAGAPISLSAIKYGAGNLWSGLPKLIVVMAGGFLTNFVWCSYLIIKNRTINQFMNRRSEPKSSTILVNNQKILIAPKTLNDIPIFSNYVLSALAGTIWYFQFFFYTMGESQMGNYKFSSWTLHMASIIIFSSLWGIYLKEWNTTSGLTKFLLGIALFSLVSSTIIIGYANLIANQRMP